MVGTFVSNCSSLKTASASYASLLANTDERSGLRAVHLARNTLEAKMGKERFLWQVQ